MATAAKNTVVAFEYSADGGTNWTSIPGVKRVNMGSATTEQLDATDFDSTGNHRETIDGYNDYAEGSFEMHFQSGNAAQEAIRAAHVAGTVMDLRVTAGSETRTFQALITSFEQPIAVGEIMMTNVGLKITGAVTYATS